MVRILTIGFGYIGSVLAKHLSNKIPSAEIVISDEKKKIDLPINMKNLSYLQLDLIDYDKIVKTAKNFDIIIGLAPGRFGYKTIIASIEASVDMVDLSYMPEDPLLLNERALEAGVTIIPDCGVAPGLSNILIGRSLGVFERIKDVFILVGGLPQKRLPPLEYKITWCVEDLIEEYVRKAKIVIDGKTIEVEALSGLEEIEFAGIGKLEAFYTDGVRTLHHSIKNAVNMWEKTLRYPGHSKKIKLLRELGFFDEKKVGSSSPRRLSINLLEQKLSMSEIKDFLVMKTRVNGIVGNECISHGYSIMDYYDENKKITAMGRTTAYTASIVTQLLAKKVIKEKGVVPPEKLGTDKEIFEKIMTGLREEGIEIERS
jgi:saccharopine dehydrogenase-like NADP-dependent oxidoreductase